MLKVLAVVTACGLAGCASPGPRALDNDTPSAPAVAVAEPGAPALPAPYAWHRVVLIDANFGAGYAMQQVNAALTDWETTTHAVFDRVVLPTAEIAAIAAAGGDDGNIYLVTGAGDAVSGDGQACPVGPRIPDCCQGLTTPGWGSGPETVCIDLADVWRYDAFVPGRSEIKGAVAHEIGHAMGLHHSAAGSLMYHESGPDQADHLTCDDLEQLAALTHDLDLSACAQ